MASVCVPQSIPETLSNDISDSEMSFYPEGDMKPCMQEILSPVQTDMLSWTQQHPFNWNTIQVLDWIYYVAEALGMDVAELRGESFQNINGQQLCRMSKEDFCNKDQKYGSQFHENLTKLITDSTFIEPSPVDYSADCGGQFAELVSALTNNDEEIHKMLDKNIEILERKVNPTNGCQSYNILGAWYDIDDSMDFPMDPSADSGYISGDSCDGHSIPDCITDSPVFSEAEEAAFPVTVESPNPEAPNPVKKKSRKRNSSSISTDSGVGDGEEGSERKKGNRGRKVGQSSKGNHLWEFIRDLLKNSNFNPTLLRWEDKEAGVFRFVQSEAVAQMWGRQKNNTTMTYEKLSRAMRFCRTAGYFADVPKNGKFPKKLCFKFGPKAFGWRDM